MWGERKRGTFVQERTWVSPEWTKLQRDVGDKQANKMFKGEHGFEEQENLDIIWRGKTRMSNLSKVKNASFVDLRLALASFGSQLQGSLFLTKSTRKILPPHISCFHFIDKKLWTNSLTLFCCFWKRPGPFITLILTLPISSDTGFTCLHSVSNLLL